MKRRDFLQMVGGVLIAFTVPVKYIQATVGKEATKFNITSILTRAYNKFYQENVVNGKHLTPKFVYAGKGIFDGFTDELVAIQRFRSGAPEDEAFKTIYYKACRMYRCEFLPEWYYKMTAVPDPEIEQLLRGTHV